MEMLSHLSLKCGEQESLLDKRNTILENVIPVELEVVGVTGMKYFSIRINGNE